MNCKYEFQFGHMEIIGTCAVFTSNEGVHIDTAETREIWAVLKEIYGEKKFGFIANRINSYSVNPIAVKNVFLHETVVAGAIVSKTKWGKIISELELKLIKKTQTQHFESLDSAINWVGEVVDGNTI